MKKTNAALLTEINRLEAEVARYNKMYTETHQMSIRDLTTAKTKYDDARVEIGRLNIDNDRLWKMNLALVSAIGRIQNPMQSIDPYERDKMIKDTVYEASRRLAIRT